MWITLDQIECLKAIKEAGSITAAANKLKRAKSAIYYGVKRLEEQVGFKLIRSGTYRGSLTNQGEQLYIKAEPILFAIAKLKEDCHQIATGVEVKIAISATEIFCLKKFNKAIKDLQNRYPDTEFIFHREMLSGEKLLQQGVVDIAIFESILMPGECEYKKIDEVKMVLVIARDHPFFRLHSRERTKANLFHYPQIVQRSTIPDTDVRGVFQESRQWTVSDLNSKRQIILEGLGWGRLPLHEIEDELNQGKLGRLDFIEDPIVVPIYIGRHKVEKHGKVSKALWKKFDRSLSI